MKLLLHACCGPCALMPLRLLAEDADEIAVFYSNSNIAPEAEYERRWDELQRYCGTQGIPVQRDAYDPDEWEAKVAPVGESLKAYSPAFGAESSAASVQELLDDERRSERCRLCYRMRLQKAAAFAAREGFDGLASSLAVSPYQFAAEMDEELARACEPLGLVPVIRDFRPYYREATALSRELGMYRQNYCGCRFSVAEAEATRAFIKAQRKARKAARKA